MEVVSTRKEGGEEKVNCIRNVVLLSLLAWDLNIPRATWVEGRLPFFSLLGRSQEIVQGMADLPEWCLLQRDVSVGWRSL